MFLFVFKFLCFKFKLSNSLGLLKHDKKGFQPIFVVFVVEKEGKGQNKW